MLLDEPACPGREHAVRGLHGFIGHEIVFFYDRQKPRLHLFRRGICRDT